MAKDYKEQRDRNFLTMARVRTYGTLNPIKFGTVAELGDYLDQDQSEFLIRQADDEYETLAAAAARCVISAYALEKLPYEVKMWVRVRSRAMGLTEGEFIAAAVISKFMEE